MRLLLLVSLSTMERASLSGKQPLLKKALCSTTGDPWGTGKDVGKRHPTVREGALVSAHAQVIGPIEIGAKAKVGAGAVVVSDVPSDVTVVGVPAKIVRVHGKKDEPIIHQEEEKREYYVNKLEHAKEASHRSSSL